MNRKLSVRLESWPSIIPFRISNHVWDDFPCVVCEIEQDGVTGRGEALGVYYHDEKGRLCSILTSWTSLAPPDPFIEAADGRAHFRFEDLLRLTEWLQQPAGDRS